MERNNLDPADPLARLEQTFPTFTAEQCERLKKYGSVRAACAGEMLFEKGQRRVDFFVMLEGQFEIITADAQSKEVSFRVESEGQFTGELHLFNNREVLVSCRVKSPGQVLQIPNAQFRKMLTAEPELGEMITRAFILRRTAFLNQEQAGITMIGVRGAAECLRIQNFLRRNGYPVHMVDPAFAEAIEILANLKVESHERPVVVSGNRQVCYNPSNARLGRLLGFTEEIPPGQVFDVTIVGAGPAGLAAAVYASSEGLKTLVLESEAPGGQAGTSSRIENYLGFPSGISGHALAGRAQIQAQKFGAHISVPRSVEKLNCAGSPYLLRLDDGSEVKTKTVVIASGARYRRLDLEKMRKFEGSGIHYAATAIEATICAKEEIIVVGGGNSAGQAALFLSRHASHVHVVVRADGLAASMSAYLIERLEASPAITLHCDTEITKLEGEAFLEKVTLTNRRTDEVQTRPVSHIFLMLGASPNTEWLNGCVNLDEKGFVVSAPNFETSQPGVFAVGDVRSGSIKRVASAVGEGSVVISAIHQALSLR